MVRNKAKEDKIRIPYNDTEVVKDRIILRSEKEEDSMNKTIHKAVVFYLDYLDGKEGGVRL